MRIPVILVSFLLAACGGGDRPATPLFSDVMRAEIEQFRVSKGMPGLSVVVADAERIEAFTTGVRRVGGADPLQESDRFEIGSLSKAMTGILIARLVEQKKLRWNETLGEVFPAWQGGMHAHFKSATIEQLLQHRSGLPYDFEDDDVRALLPNATGDMALDRAMAARYFLQREPLHAPGTNFLYSNLGYIVLGLAAEARGGDTYRKLMAREVFSPLQVAADVGAPEGSGLSTLAGHVQSAEGWLPLQASADTRLWLAMTEAAGGVTLPMRDYGRYLQEQLKGLHGASTFLQKATFERIHSPLPGYGHGWGVMRHPELGRLSQHNGSNGSHFSFALVLHDQRRALAISCNCYSEKAMADIEEFASRLAAEAARL